MADRAGRLEDRPVRIKAEVFPYDDLDVNFFLNRLAAPPEPFILRYQTAGKRYIQIATSSKHFHPHHQEPPSEIPPPNPTKTKPLKVPKNFGSPSELDPKSSRSNPSLSLDFNPLSVIPLSKGEGSASLENGNVGQAASASKYPKPDWKVEPEKALSCAYRKLRKIPEDQWSKWDEDNFEEFRPALRTILDICGNVQRAYECMREKISYFESRGFKHWTINRIAKDSYQWAADHPVRKKNHSEENHGNGTGHSQSVPVPDAQSESAGEVNANRNELTAAEALARVRNLPAVQTGSRAGQREKTRGNEQKTRGNEKGSEGLRKDSVEGKDSRLQSGESTPEPGRTS